jgi:hypothetical protein
MPTKNSERDYTKEYARDHGKPQDIKDRAARNAAVAKLGRKGKSSQDGKEVDHVRGVGAGNGRSNLQVVKRSTNRRKA